MPIDYSKWDKIELSDDSDVEVHPNVDKRSFINWKQRDIHEKRIQRNNEIKGLQIQKEMYLRLNDRVDKLLNTLNEEAIVNEKARNAFLRENFDPAEKCSIEQGADNPPYNEMVEDLFVQISDDLKKENKDPTDATQLVTKVKEHRAKISSVLEQIDPKLEELNKEKEMHISSEDIRDGWNSSFINKNSETASSEPKKANVPTKSTTAKTIETINSPAPAKKQVPSKPLDQLDELELLQETEQFSKISSEDLLKSIKFLEDHLYIVSEQQKDALMMKSFDYQLDGDSKSAKQSVHQALILQYLDDLFKAAGGARATVGQKEQAIGLFIGKLLDKNSPASRTFDADWKKTYNHIVSRCEIIKQEHGEQEEGPEGVEQIQLRSMDPNSELIVNLPAQTSPEYEVFKKIPEPMQKALETEKLDEINRVFATMSVDDAENVLELFDQCGVIQIQALLENEDEFNRLKGEYNPEDVEQLEEIEEGEEVPAGNEGEFTQTADVVD